MGTSCSSITFLPDDRIKGQSSKVLIICTELGFTLDDINKMYIFFRSMDVLMTGLITSNSLAHSLKLPNSNFGELVMRIFDPSGGNSVNFEDFTIACWIILTLEEASIATFSFHLLDREGYGKFVQDEIEVILKTVLELPVESKLLAIDLFLRLGDDETGAISADTFNAAVNEFPFLIAHVRVMYNIIHNGSVKKKRSGELMTFRRRKFGNLSLMGIISTMKTKPASYENLIRTHGIDGSEHLIQGAKIGSTATDSTRPCPNQDSGRDRRTYFSPVFSVEPVYSSPSACMDNPQRASQNSSPKARRKHCPLNGRKKNSVLSKLPTLSSFRSKNKSNKSCRGRQKVIPIGIKKETDESGENFTSPMKSSDEKKSSEISGTYDSKKEALKVLQEWSTKRSPPQANGSGGSHSYRERKSSRKSQRLNLSNSKWQDPAVRRQEEQDDQVVQLIEASFWTPGQQWSTKEKNDHNGRNSLQSSSFSDTGRCRSGSHSRLYE